MAKLSRNSKEKGYKIYRAIVHMATIVLLYLLYRSLYVNHDGSHWFFGLGVVYFIVRLAIFSSREGRAYKMGITITEYMEMSLQERTDKFNNNNNKKD